MALTVYAEDMGLFHKGSGGKGTAPLDVCLSPPPSPTGPVPVPYVNLLQASNLAKGSKTVKIFGEEYTVECETHTMPYFSAHADRDGLLAYVEGLDRERLKNVFLVHGEIEQATALKKALKEQDEGCQRAHREPPVLTQAARAHPQQQGHAQCHQHRKRGRVKDIVRQRVPVGTHRLAQR